MSGSGGASQGVQVQQEFGDAVTGAHVPDIRSAVRSGAAPSVCPALSEHCPAQCRGGCSPAAATRHTVPHRAGSAGHVSYVSRTREGASFRDSRVLGETPPLGINRLRRVTGPLLLRCTWAVVKTRAPEQLDLPPGCDAQRHRRRTVQTAALDRHPCRRHPCRRHAARGLLSCGDAVQAVGGVSGHACLRCASTRAHLLRPYCSRKELPQPLSTSVTSE